MKSEHRHHLAENDLEHRLGDLAEKLKPYANHILFGTLGIAVVAVIAVVVFQNAGAAEKNAWAEFAACRPGNANQYIEAAKAYPDSSMAQWAWINAGEILLFNGVEQSFSSRTVAVDNLQKAQDAFQAVLNESGVEPEARERALSGLARTLEALSDDNTQPAIDAYTELINDFPESRFRRWAEYRIEELQSPAVKEFYGWYHAQNPDPADRPLPQDDPHAGLPGFSPFLEPDSSGTNLPDLDDILGPADTAADPEMEDTDTESDQPADSESSAATEGPALGPPSTEEDSTESTEPSDDASQGEATTPGGETGSPAAPEEASTSDGAASEDSTESVPATESESSEAADPS